MFHANNPLHGRAIADELRVSYDPSRDAVLSRTGYQQNLLGGVLYTGFTGASVTTHMVGFSPYWLSRQFLWLLFDYPFNQLRVRKIFAPVPATNARSLEITRKMGFKSVAQVADVYEDGDMVLMALPRAECRWLDTRASILQTRKAA